MTAEQKAKVERLKADCNAPKGQLISIWQSLYDVGAVKEAEKLGAIIGRLEAWQNK